MAAPPGTAWSRCGAIATISDGRFVALQPDPSHPTGQALCVKGKAAPELVYHADRLLHPLKRTHPKGAADPGWQRITWGEALDTVAARLLTLAHDYGPESVVFSVTSPSTSAMSDPIDWVMRLRRAFGSPNQCVYMELCGWGRYLAPTYTCGASVPGAYLPELDHAGCILYWGYNPSVARLAHATSTVVALARGAHLVVVDPRRAGLAAKADHWLRVRPGTDAALALSLTHSMIVNGWFDADFVRRWTNAPLIVRADTGRLLRGNELSPAGDPAHYVAWDEPGGRPVCTTRRPAGTRSVRSSLRCSARARSQRRPDRWRVGPCSTSSPSSVAGWNRRWPRRSPGWPPTTSSTPPVLAVARGERHTHARGLGAQLLERHTTGGELMGEGGVNVSVPELLTPTALARCSGASSSAPSIGLVATLGNNTR